MKKILLLILITAFIGCETEPKLAGQFLVGQDGVERKLELGSDEDAMFIKEAVLGWAAKEYDTDLWMCFLIKMFILIQLLMNQEDSKDIG